MLTLSFILHKHSAAEQFVGQTGPETFEHLLAARTDGLGTAAKQVSVCVCVVRPVPKGTGKGPECGVGIPFTIIHPLFLSSAL